jgi:putative transposase
MNHSKPNRRSVRLPDWDYRSAGFYFITICTYKREHIFEDPRLHEIATNAWAYIPQQPHAKNVVADESVIMPNHGHGVLQFISDPDAQLSDVGNRHNLLANSIGSIVGNYKMLVTKRVKAILKVPDSNMQVWQRGYWERVIRNEQELNAIRKYIQENPIRWQEDRDNLNELLAKMRYVDGV